MKNLNQLNTNLYDSYMLEIKWYHVYSGDILGAKFSSAVINLILHELLLFNYVQLKSNTINSNKWRLIHKMYF